MPSSIMLRNLKQHILLGLIFFLLTLSQQYFFYAAKSLPIIYLSTPKLVGIFCFLFFFTFAKGTVTRYLLLSFVIILNYFQMAHLSYFGTQILPNEIYLLFAEFSEVGGVLQAELSHIILPLLFTIIPLGIGWWAIKKITPTYQFKAVPILFCLYFAYNPARTYITGNTWGRQPSTRELSGMNVYLSLSYFLGRILPHKLNGEISQGENSSLKLTLKKINESQWDNIIVVLGESLTPNHMQLFGYPKDTTPYLVTKKDSAQFHHLKGLSGGVSTDISVAFFLNMGFGDAGARKAAKGNHCLFKLAKDSGFSTSFLSIQSAEQLRYIAPYLCSASLDRYSSLEDISPATPDHNAALDHDLIGEIDGLLSNNKKNFIMLHQRGSHGPWGLRFRKKVARFHSATGEDSRVNDYDNSVVEFDLFWEALENELLKAHGRNLLIYLSDHGEGVGEDGKWGHGSLTSVSFEVPIIIQAFNADLPVNTHKLPAFLPHYNLALFLGEALGYKANQNYLKTPSDYVIYGNDIDGFAGKAEVSFLKDEYKFKIIP